MRPSANPTSLAKLVFVWGMITAILLLLISVRLSISALEQRLVDEAEVLGRGEISRIALIAERTIEKDRYLIKDVMSQAATDQRLHDIMILDPQRKVIYANRSERIGRSALELLPFKQSLIRNLELQGPMVTYSQQEGLTIGFAKSFSWPPAPGQIRSNQLGYVLLVADMQELKKRRWIELMSEELVISAVYITALLLLLTGIFFRIKQPLRTLTDASQKFSKGEFGHKLNIPNILEMKELAESFNMMSSEIQQQISALQLSENTFKSLIENSPVGIVTFDGNGREIYHNHVFTEMTGISDQHLHGMTEEQFETVLFQLQSSENPQPGRTSKDLSSSSNSGTESEILEIYSPELKVIARFQINPENPKIKSIMYFQDITSISKIDRMKSEFITTAAHELRTPMTSILGYTELLLNRSLKPAQQKEMLDSIHTHAQSIVHLLDELLDVALIESRADRAFSMEETDIAEVVESVASDFMVAGDPRKVVLMPVPPLSNIRIDREKISQALKNCLSNAYKFSNQNNDVVISAKMQGNEEVVISIQDAGIGMSAEVQAKVFEKFYRADNSGHIPGTGLGMTLVKQIIDHHRGRIEIISEMGKGTCINLHLPVNGNLSQTQN